MRRSLKWLLILGVLVGLGAAVAVPTVSWWRQHATPRYLTAPVSRGRVETVVNSTGTIKPVRTVSAAAPRGTALAWQGLHRPGRGHASGAQGQPRLHRPRVPRGRHRHRAQGRSRADGGGLVPDAGIVRRRAGDGQAHVRLRLGG